MAAKKAKREKQEKHGKGMRTWPFYAALAVLFVLYIYFQHVQTLSLIFGLMLFFTITVLVALEIISSVREEGYKKNLTEIAIAVLAIIIFWVALRLVLQTDYPLNVVPSCSMLPNLQRGDMVLLQGIGNAVLLKAPVINMNQSAYRSLIDYLKGGQPLCVAYKQVDNHTYISQKLAPNYSIGLYKSYGNEVGIVPQDSQTGPIAYTCGTRTMQYLNGTTGLEVYTAAVTIAGTTIIGNANNTVIVYETTLGDYFYSIGDAYIVHRIYVMLNVDGDYYALTKGDNNPGLDIQYENYPIKESNIEGKVIAAIPYLGYLKLVLSNQFNEPAGCNSYHVSE
jgi:signal peptidase I